MSLESFKLCLDTHYLLCINDIKFTIYRHYKWPKSMNHYNTILTTIEIEISLGKITKISTHNFLLNYIFPISCLHNIFHSPFQSNSSCYCTTIICNAFMHDKKAMYVLLKSFKLIRI